MNGMTSHYMFNNFFTMVLISGLLIFDRVLTNATIFQKKSLTFHKYKRIINI